MILWKEKLHIFIKGLQVPVEEDLHGDPLLSVTDIHLLSHRLVTDHHLLSHQEGFMVHTTLTLATIRQEEEVVFVVEGVAGVVFMVEGVAGVISTI